VRRAIVLVAAILLAACGGGDDGVELTGGEIAFTVNSAGWGEIWLMAPDGSDRRRLTETEPADNDAAGASSPAWSPDGTRIAYAAQVGTLEEDQSLSEIYVMNADGSDRRRLTTNEDFDGDPVWSPDGQRLAFTHATGIGTDAVRSGIAVMNADGGPPRQITHARGGKFDGTPAWSPDGSRIAFTRATFGEEDATFDLFTVASDGTGLEKIVSGGGDPSWSPDGTRIAYSSIRDRLGITCFQECATSGEIYVADADGKRQRRLTRTEADEGSPAWSPDGRRIAFVSDESDRRAHENEIYVMDADGDRVRRLTQNQVWDLEPAWRPR
jgi:Tol biopolymer transport system component